MMKLKATATVSKQLKHTTSPAAILVENAYAQKQNSRYDCDIDEYVGVQQRLQGLINSDHTDTFEDLFIELAEEFRDRYPQYETYADMIESMVGQGSEGYRPIVELDINITMQRLADRDWLVRILGTFDPILVNPVRVYCDPHRTDGGQNRFVAWDGQHTSLILYMIAVYGFKMDPQDVMIPTSLYPGSDRAAIRRQFMYYNAGLGSKPLDAIDLFMQYVYGYNNDGSREDMNVRCHLIQNLAEQYTLFLTNEKFGDQDMPGAVVRLSEIMNRNYSVDVIGSVFYYHSITKPSKPMPALEMDNLCHYFKACEDQGIDVDHAYIDRMAEVLAVVTNNTWDKGSIKHNKVKTAYENWFKEAKRKGFIQSDKAPRCNQTEIGPIWLAQSLKLNQMKQPVPYFPQDMKFADKDLM
jgi:hypothetical protein